MNHLVVTLEILASNVITGRAWAFFVMALEVAAVVGGTLWLWTARPRR